MKFLKATWCRATERLRRCKCWQCWESCKHRRETSGSASQQQHQFCSQYFILVYLYMLDCAIQCATRNSLTWSNPNVWQSDVIPIRPFLDNHDGISLCSPICARIILYLGFQAESSDSLFPDRFTSSSNKILRIYPKQRSDGQTTFFHKRSCPFSSFFHLLISSIDHAPLLQHHHPPFPHRELWCVADEAQNRLQGAPSATRLDGVEEECCW